MKRPLDRFRILSRKKKLFFCKFSNFHPLKLLLDPFERNRKDEKLIKFNVLAEKKINVYCLNFLAIITYNYLFDKMEMENTNFTEPALSL